MITSAHRAVVSIASFTLLAATVALGGCVRPSAAAPDAPAPSASFRFDNEAETFVDVYLVGEQRSWRLGRVAPGGRVELRIPEIARGPAPGFLRLAVLAGAAVSLQPANDPNAILTIAQPLSALVSQRWTFAFAPGGSPQIIGARADGRP